jgi:hypothetical protein
MRLNKEKIETLLNVYENYLDGEMLNINEKEIFIDGYLLGYNEAKMVYKKNKN